MRPKKTKQGFQKSHHLSLGRFLATCRKEENLRDRYAGAVCKVGKTVVHIPKSISTVFEVYHTRWSNIKLQVDSQVDNDIRGIFHMASLVPRPHPLH